MLVFILFLPAGIQQFTIFQIPGIHFSYPQVCLADKDRLPGIPAEKRRSGGHAEKMHSGLNIVPMSTPDKMINWLKSVG